MWTGTANQIEWILIRHGQTASNRSRRYLGRTDEPLDGEGRAALEELRERGRYPAAEVCFSSPMARCVESARILFPGITPVVIPEWREIDFGDFEGKSYRELSGNPDYQAWIDSGGTMRFPNGESREAFAARCLAGYRRMAKRLLDMPQVERAAAVVHGGTIMELISRLYGGGYYDYQVKNGGGYRCVLRRDTGTVTEIEELV